MNTKIKARWIIGTVVLLALVFRGTVGPVVTTVVFWALILGALLFLPAFIGAAAGGAVRDGMRWLRKNSM